MDSKFFQLTSTLCIFMVLFQITISHPVSVSVRLRPNTTRSDMCPHGVHYLDECKNICACNAEHGGSMCTKGNQIDCPISDERDLCPFGKEYSDPDWKTFGHHCTCYCNEDESKTYECFEMKE